MHDEFLTALRENPNDSVTRLVYADWLDEHDDPLAEFLRLEVRLAGGVSEDERVEGLNRLAELGRRAEPGWLLAVNRSPFLRCAVRKRTGGSPLAGTLELANYATRTLLVAFRANVLQYLWLTITAPLGESSDNPYELFTLGDGRELRLSPGERASIRVNLLNTIPESEITVGTYTIEASYRYDEVTSRADSVRVELTDEDRRRWRLGRYAHTS